MGIGSTLDISRQSADPGQDGVDAPGGSHSHQIPPAETRFKPALSERCGLRSPIPTSPIVNPFLTPNHLDPAVSPNDVNTFADRTPLSRPRGIGRDAQLINGNSIEGDNMFPWMLALWQDMGSGLIVPTCGAALISRTHAISAAHCVLDPGARYILRGGSRFNRMPNPFGGNRVPGPVGGLAIDVAEVQVHPQFNPFNFENDIALFRFAKVSSRPPPPPSLMDDLGSIDDEQVRC